MTDSHPTRRWTLLAAAGALGQTQQGQAQHDPFLHNAQWRKAERKKAAGLKYKRDPESLKRMAYEGYGSRKYPLILEVLDAAEVKEEELQGKPGGRHGDGVLQTRLLKLLDNDPEKAARNNRFVCGMIDAMQAGQRMSYSAFLHEREDAYTKLMVLNPVRKIGGRNPNEGYGLDVFELDKWGLRENIDTSLSQAFYDYHAVGRAVCNWYDLGAKPGAENVAYIHARAVFCDVLATLMLARQFGTTYPARVIGAFQAVGLMQRALFTGNYVPLKHKIPDDAPAFTAHAITEAANEAQPLIESGALRSAGMQELVSQAQRITERCKLSPKALGAFGEKIVQARKKMQLPGKAQLEQIFTNPVYFAPAADPLDKAVIEAHLFLFKEFGLPQTAVERR